MDIQTTTQLYYFLIALGRVHSGVLAKLRDTKITTNTDHVELLITDHCLQLAELKMQITELEKVLENFQKSAD